MMLRLYKINKTFISFIFFALIILQGCSSKYSSYNPWSKNNDANINRRSPSGNPNGVQPPAQSNSTSDAKQDFSEYNQAYQRYKANQPITLEEFDKQRKRYPRLNVTKLNLAMDNSAIKSTTPTESSKPIEISSTANLKEVIDYNKKQQVKKSSSPHLNKSSTKKKIVKKTTAQENIKIKKDVIIADSKQNKSSNTLTTTQTAVPAAPSSINSTTNNNTKFNNIKSVANLANEISTSKPIIPAQNDNIVDNTEIIQSAITNSSINQSNSIPSKVESSQAPVAVNATKNNSAAGLKPKPTQVNGVAINQTNTSQIPAPLQTNQIDIDRMNQDEIEDYLKRKFKNSSSKGFIDKLEDDSAPTQQANSTANTSSSTSNMNNTSSNAVPSPIIAPAAVSKILTTHNYSKINKINTLMLECYLQLKQKIVSTIFKND